MDIKSQGFARIMAKIGRYKYLFRWMPVMVDRSLLPKVQIWSYSWNLGSGNYMVAASRNTCRFIIQSSTFSISDHYLGSYLLSGLLNSNNYLGKLSVGKGVAEGSSTQESGSGLARKHSPVFTSGIIPGTPHSLPSSVRHCQRDTFCCCLQFTWKQS
jgi:hypothetical protein